MYNNASMHLENESMTITKSEVISDWLIDWLIDKAQAMSSRK